MIVDRLIHFLALEVYFMCLQLGTIIFKTDVFIEIMQLINVP